MSAHGIHGTVSHADSTDASHHKESDPVVPCLRVAHGHLSAGFSSSHATVVSTTMTTPATETQYYEHGRFKVSGGVLPNAITAYRTYGDPSNPCIVFPTCYGAKMHLGSESLAFALPEEIKLIDLMKGQDYLVGQGKVRMPNSD